MASSIIERFSPIFAGILTLLLCLLFRVDIVELFKEEKLTIVGLYGAVFGWSAIQTGFLFGVFGFVTGTKEGFIDKIKETTPVVKFINYTRNATIIGFVLTFASMPFMILSKELWKAEYWLYVAIAAWFALFVWAFLAFARVAYLFGLLIKPKAKDQIPG